MHMSERDRDRLNLNFRERAENRDQRVSEEDMLTSGRLHHDLRSQVDDVFSTVMKDLSQSTEDELKERFIERESEEKVPSFKETFNYLKNLEKRWISARERKTYEEIGEKDLERLNNLLEDVEKGIRLELKATCYLSIFIDKLRETEIQPGEVPRYFEEEVEARKERVGDYIREAAQEVEEIDGSENSQRRYKKVASEVNERLEKEEERMKDEIRSENLLEKYRGCMELLKGIEKELEAIERASEDEMEILEKIRGRLRFCIGNSKVMFEERRRLVDRIKASRGLRETMSKVFYRGFTS